MFSMVEIALTSDSASTTAEALSLTENRTSELESSEIKSASS